MPGDRLTALQHRILRVLAPVEPRWTLTGGGALAGVHLGHRETRDLDLFWRDRAQLGELVRDVRAALRADGLEVEALRSAPTFGELRVADGHGVCVVDLVAEPGPSLEPPEIVTVQDATIAVDTTHEILVNKLTALLGRSELRDLVDVRALLEAGIDFDRALRDAPKKDGGFSAMTLAWVLKDLNPGPLAQALGWNEAQATQLSEFLEWLRDRLVAVSAPE